MSHLLLYLFQKRLDSFWTYYAFRLLDDGCRDARKQPACLCALENDAQLLDFTLPQFHSVILQKLLNLACWPLHQKSEHF